MAAAPAMAPVKSQTPVRASFIVGVVIVLALFAWFANNAVQQEKAKSTRPFSEVQFTPVQQLHTTTIGSGAVTVPASNYTYFTLPVPARANNVRVQGHFSATGGSGNDIEVFLLNADQYTNWQNGHSTPTFYNSGKVTVGDANAVLPSDAGTYYLVFNNRFSMFSPKAVEEHFTLTYYQ